MSREIAEGKGVIVRRDDAKNLLSVRRGELDLESIIEEVERESILMDELFKKSDLPDEVDTEFTNDLLIKIRKKVYDLK